MKNKVSLLIPVAATLVLAACGPTSAPATSEGGLIKDATTITFMSNSSYGDTIDAIIAEFKKIEPNVTVNNVKETGSYDDVKKKVISQLATDEHPDLFVGYPDSVQEIMQYDKVVQLDDYMNDKTFGWSDAEKKDIIPAYLAEGASYPVKGYWSLPFAKSTEAMYYNKTVLVGLDLHAQDATINEGKPLTETYINNLTWEELFGKLLPAIKSYNDAQTPEKKIIKESEKYGSSIFGYDSDDNLFITLAEQYGYGYTSIKEDGTGSLDFVNDGMKGLMKTFNAAHNAGTPEISKGEFITKGSFGNYTNYVFTAQASLFSIGSTGGIKYQQSNDFETGVAKIPHAAGKAAKVINQGPSLAILDHKDKNRATASWLFYKFLTNETNATQWAVKTGYSPIRYSTLDSDDYIEYSRTDGKESNSLEALQARVAQYVSTVSDDLYTSPVFKGSATARTEVGALVTKLLGKKTTELTDAVINEAFDLAKSNTLKKM